MKEDELNGKIQTVLGLIDPYDLGLTLAHEHLLIDLSVYFMEPEEATLRARAFEPVNMRNIAEIQLNRLPNKDALLLNDVDIAVREALLFKYAGGNAIVEMSNIGNGRDPLGLVQIAFSTGLHIVMGCGYYVGASHPPEMSAMTEKEISEGIIKDIFDGVGDTGVRAGIIGEIGCSAPLMENEKKVLRAAALAQQKTGAAINVHPSPQRDDLALEIVEILKEAGADLSRTVISHVDLFSFSLSTRLQLLDAGCYVEYDGFGMFSGPVYIDGGWQDFPSDSHRIDDIKQLIDKGYLNQILMASDHCSKVSLNTYGGFGYAYVLKHIVPAARAKGISDDQLNTMLIDNPRRVLTFVSADK